MTDDAHKDQWADQARPGDIVIPAGELDSEKYTRLCDALAQLGLGGMVGS
ncbi:MAG TPA: hypothetical protein VK674_01530 [Candidatus Limnocylindria bacterium]|nr:hypothetical protein [Candidatus Limnocylindria bacterium]